MLCRQYILKTHKLLLFQNLYDGPRYYSKFKFAVFQKRHFIFAPMRGFKGFLCKRYHIMFRLVSSISKLHLLTQSCNWVNGFKIPLPGCVLKVVYIPPYICCTIDSVLYCSTSFLHCWLVSLFTEPAHTVSHSNFFREYNFIPFYKDIFCTRRNQNFWRSIKKASRVCDWCLDLWAR